MPECHSAIRPRVARTVRRRTYDQLIGVQREYAVQIRKLEPTPLIDGINAKTRRRSILKKLNTNLLTQLAGEYHVCTELSRLGILALPAPKNKSARRRSRHEIGRHKDAIHPVKMIRQQRQMDLSENSAIQNRCRPKLYLILVQFEIGRIDRVLRFRYNDF